MSAYRTYTTSQLADAAEVGPQTLRYYERRGLLPEPPRTAGGHRIYGPGHLRRLVFIQRVQSLGFDLQQVHEMLGLGQARSGRRAAVGDEVDELLATIDEKLETLREIRGCLETLRSSGGGAEGPDALALEELVGEAV